MNILIDKIENCDRYNFGQSYSIIESSVIYNEVKNKELKIYI